MLAEKKMSQRLLAAAALVPACGCVADVGTDHGYLPVYLVQAGRAQRGIAMDVRKGPLARADETVRQAGLSDRIALRLSDGLAALQVGEADAATITGMGGMLICRILTACPAVTARLNTLVLGPQSDVAAVRTLLAPLGFAITDECAVIEDGKFYFLIRADRRRAAAEQSEAGNSAAGAFSGAAAAGNSAAGLPDGTAGGDALACAFGPVLLARRDVVLRQYLEKQYATNRQILQHLRAGDSEAAAHRSAELAAEAELLRRALALYT